MRTQKRGWKHHGMITFIVPLTGSEITQEMQPEYTDKSVSRKLEGRPILSVGGPDPGAGVLH